MPGALTTRATIACVVTGLLLTFSDSARAQAGASEATEGGTTWFQMFFVPENGVGLAVVWLLLLMSAFSIGFAIKLIVDYRRSALLPETTREDIEALLQEKKFRDAVATANADDSYLGRLTSAALNEAPNGYPAMERAIEETADTEVGRYLRPVEYLNVLGNISPMIGLFGTVYGMIVSFQKLVTSSGNPDPSQLAGGIATALVTTFWGLVVAIPALAAYSLIRNKLDATTSEGIVLVEQVIEPFKPKRQSRSQQTGSE
jgi:biopolymer transport protein ExbB